MNFIDSVEFLKSRALTIGDTLAYDKLYIYYLDSSPEFFVKFADSFATKFNYNPAHFDIYRKIQLMYGFSDGEFSKKDIEPKDYDLLLKHLSMAEKNGYEDVILVMKKHREYLRKLKIR